MMNPEPPPILDPNSSLPPVEPANLARWGMRLSLVAPVVILLMFLMEPG
jgi:hypothetical protein